jgi:hypothetical protein
MNIWHVYYDPEHDNIVMVTEIIATDGVDISRARITQCSDIVYLGEL